MPQRVPVRACAPFLLACALGACSRAPASPFEFVDVRAASGIDLVNVCGDARRWYIPESNGNGAAWIDYDGDGKFDLFLGNGARFEYLNDGAKLALKRDGRCKLYRNLGGLKFEDVSAKAGLDRSDWVNGVATADPDNDGDTDLYLACFGPDVYLRNEGGRFTDATAESGLGNAKWGASAAFGDADNDGDLDLYVANYCEFDPEHPPGGGKRNSIGGVEVGWGPEEENKQGVNRGAPDVFFENLGGGKFRDATEEFGFALEKALCSYGVVFSDVDGDGWQDVLVANDIQPCNLFHNDGKGRFREEGMKRGFALNAEGRPTGAMALVPEDLDGDGDFDCFRTNFDFEANSLHVNDGKGNFRDQAAVCGLAKPSEDKLGWDAGFLDADLDGDLDLLVANGHVYPQSAQVKMGKWKQPTQLFENQGSTNSTDQISGFYTHEFGDVTQHAGSGLAGTYAARGIALGDPDDDGDVDALVVDLDEQPRLLENRSNRQGHWITVRTRGTRSNRDGFGARITVKAGGSTFVRESRSASGLYSAHDPRIHFGLGDIHDVESIEVRWPSGTVTTVRNLPVDTHHVLSEPKENAR